MSTCLWCGRVCGSAAACLRCAPGQGHARDSERDSEFEPDEIYLACLDNLRALLDCYGIAPAELLDDDPEFDALNVERYLATLA